MRTRALPTGLAALLVPILLLASPSDALAGGGCAEVTEAGQCLDAQTLVWCSDGELKTATCPEGELCTDHAAFNGSYGCVPKEWTDCADIPEEGQCTSANNLVWCDANGKVKLEECGESGCAWDDRAGWYDCMPMGTAGGASAPPDEDEDPDDPDGTDGDGVDDPDASEGDDGNGDPDAGFQDGGPGEVPDGGLSTEDEPQGPTPTVSPGGTAPTLRGGSQGCTAGNGGSTGSMPAAAFALLLLGWRRRR